MKFEALHLLDDVAVVNMRDIGRKFDILEPIITFSKATKNCFKILIFPDQRMFQCASTKEKRHWLEQLEESKKTYLALKSAQVTVDLSRVLARFLMERFYRLVGIKLRRSFEDILHYRTNSNGT